MTRKSRKMINLRQSTYERLAKLKLERMKEKNQSVYSFEDFIDFLLGLYESDLESGNPGPTIYDIQESG